MAIVLGFGLGLAAPALAAPSTPRQIIADISGERHYASIPPVKEDPRLSAGCAAHDRYLELNGFGSDPHREVVGRPGYSKAGAEAAGQSDLGQVGAFDGRSPWARSDPFDPAPYHLLLLMDPLFETMGANELITPMGTAIECVNVLGGQRRGAAGGVRFWEFPGRGPLPGSYSYAEGPHAGGSGIWLFFYWLAPAHTTIELRSLTVTGPGHRKVPPLATAVSGGLRGGHAQAARTTRAPCPPGSVRNGNSCVPFQSSSSFYSPNPAAEFQLPVLRPGGYSDEVRWQVAKRLATEREIERGDFDIGGP